MDRQDLAQKILGGREMLDLVQKDRHVEVDPPFARPPATSPEASRTSKASRQIEIAGEPRDRAAPPPGADRPARRTGAARRALSASTSAMRSAAESCSLGTPDAGGAQLVEPAFGVLVLDRRVTDVVADAEMAAQRLPRRRPGSGRKGCASRSTAVARTDSRSKNRTVSSMVSRKQYGSGSSARAMVRAGPCAQLHQMGDVPHHVRRPCARPRRGASDSGLKVPGTVLTLPSRPGSSGRSARQKVGEAVGVDQPLLVQPVGLVDLLLDADAVERAVREAVDREQVEVVGAEQVAQLGERALIAQGLRGDRRQPQADAERHDPGETLRLDRGQVLARARQAPRARSRRGGCWCSR